MKKFMQEFKTFALRGNVMDMAVGVIIGSQGKDPRPGHLCLAIQNRCCHISHFFLYLKQR